MIRDDRNIQRRPGRIWAGLFLLLVGAVLLLDQMGFPLPDWLFNWHFLLIAIGLFSGLRHGFRGFGWMILIAIGGVYLAQDYYHDFNLHRFLWPGFIIMAGLLIILRPARRPRDWGGDWDRRRRCSPTFSASSQEGYISDDYINTTSVFGGVHKKIVSKNFQGGDITTLLGGTEIDLTQADFTGQVRLDVTQIMGGTKIIVPPHWEVRSEVTAMFAGFEDKRQQPAITNPDKVLIIAGTSIFGGIELKNF